jgi:hypothetical protein
MAAAVCCISFISSGTVIIGIPLRIARAFFFALPM